MAYIEYDQLADFFAGVTYVVKLGRMRLPDDSLLDKKRFNIEYGGNTFAMLPDGNRKTDSAWLACTQSYAFVLPKCFK